MLSPEAQVIEAMFMIFDKDGNDVDFVLNREQRELDENLWPRNRVPKARQLGISTYVLARFLVKCITKKNTRAVVISHDAESTKKALDKVHYMIKNMKGGKPVTGTSSRNEISFPKTNSVFYVGTAGSREFGRGDTITDLHCSEVAFWPDAKRLVKGLYQAVPLATGEIFEESTGNGVGNYYHRQCMFSYKGKSSFKLHFFNWVGVDEYKIDLTEEQRTELLDNLNEDWDEPNLVEEVGISLEQIAWRRIKLEELDFDLRDFKQEYPITIDECFQSTGFSLFPGVNYIPTDRWTQRKDLDARLWVDNYDWDRKHVGTYILGVDVGGGVGRDSSVIEVVNIETDEQVAEWASNNVPPDLFAAKIAWIAELYNNAFVTVESNNHGGITLLRLVEQYPISLIYSHVQDTDKLLEYGYRTTSKTKPLLINNLRSEFTEGLKIKSPILAGELSTFTEKDTGKLEAENGCFDDHVMALAVGVMGAKKAYLYSRLEYEKTEHNREVISPFSLDAIIEELHSKHTGEGFPIPSQHLS